MGFLFVPEEERDYPGLPQDFKEEFDVTSETEEGGVAVTPEGEDDREWSPKLTSEWEDPEAVQVWDCIVEGRLIRIDWCYLYQQDTSYFQ